MKQSAIKITQLTQIEHTAQIVTGIHSLKNHGYSVTIPPLSRISQIQYPQMAIVEAEYRGKRIIYDVLDGYQYPKEIQHYLDNCDFYFKRSYSEEKNRALLRHYQGKLFPLGFNYYVTYRGNPLNESRIKAMVKAILGRTPKSYYIPKVFEGTPIYKEKDHRVLFLTRLWSDRDSAISQELNAERSYINQMRIDIIRSLRQEIGAQFIGGLNDEPVARRLAPDLIMPAEYTKRDKYLQLLHTCDICIGSMGLHESIGWKTGEYVAASKAIVNEAFRYSVPGNFSEGVNYFSFHSAEGCLEAVQRLLRSPTDIYAMQENNAKYYHEFLRPDSLIKNTLQVVDQNIDN